MTTTLRAGGRGASPDPHAGGPGRRDVRGGAARLIARPRNLPSGRAVVGGLAVAVAALGLYAAHAAGTAAPDTSWIVATRAVPAGQTIGADDLGIAPMQLVESTARQAFSDPDEVIGHIATTSMAEGDLVQRSAVSNAAAERRAAPARRVAIELDQAPALNGHLGAGDEVDVVLTPPSGQTTDTSARVIVRSALVESVSGAEDPAVGTLDKVRLTLVVADEAAALRLVDAAATGRIPLIASSPQHLVDVGGPDQSEAPAPTPPTTTIASTVPAAVATTVPAAVVPVAPPS